MARSWPAAGGGKGAGSATSIRVGVLDAWEGLATGLDTVGRDPEVGEVGLPLGDVAALAPAADM